MKKNGFSHIRRWLWGFLFLATLSTAMIFLLVYHEIMGTLDAAIFNNLSSSLQGQASLAVSNSQLTALKYRLFILFTTGLIAICGMGYLWIRMASRRLDRPIRVIRHALSRLASGKLNETVSMDSPDEFGQIGAGINELAANLQELLLYIWKQTGECNHLLEQIKDKKAANPTGMFNQVDKAQLHKLGEAIQNLREMAKAYVFYDVHLEGEQALAVNEPGQEPSPESYS